MKIKAYLFGVSLCCVFLAGCHRFNARDETFDRYYLTTLKLSTSADILPVLSADETELISQSQSVVASWGQKKNGAFLWFNMVAFSEDDLTAARKYSLFVDEKVKSYYIRPIRKLRFDAELVLDLEFLDASYASENERRIAALKKVLADFKSDSAQLTFDSRTLESATLMVNQALNGIITQLDSSPALAVRLYELSGLEFDHMTLGPGRARLLIENDVVKIKIKIGKDWFNMQRFEHHPDVINM